jgi:PAS domain S-box
MRPQLSLSAQVVILVMLPLIIQLGSFIWLGCLQHEAEKELKSSTKAGRIASTINRLQNAAVAAIARYGKESDFEYPTLDPIGALETKFHDNYKTLLSLTADDPKLHALALDSQKAGAESLRILGEIKISMQRPDGDSEYQRKYRNPLWKELRKNFKRLLNPALMEVGRDQKRLAEQSPEKQAEIRQDMQKLMLIAGLVNLFLASVAATYLTIGIADKIQRIRTNTVRLALDQPLAPQLEGNDDLAKLDQVFHQMAAALNELATKERAVITNARDMICSIDRNGKFISVNPASEKLLGFMPEDLLGMHLVDLVAPTDVARTVDFLEQLKVAEATSPLETQMRKKDRLSIDVLLSAHYTKAADSTFCVIHDITERKQAERLRQEVVAMVTHDLRTPLGTVKNILELLQRSHFDDFDEKDKKYVISGQRNVDRMMTLINDLLDIEKITSGRMKLDLGRVVLQELFDASLELHQEGANQADVSLVIKDTDIVFEGDEEKLQRVLSNLISNAIKFSPPKGTVTVKAQSGSKDLRIFVEDEGPGIPPDQLQSVFERFHQVETQKKTGGSGLGLAICKAITNLHAGNIWVESEVDKGSKFIVSLPVMLTASSSLPSAETSPKKETKKEATEPKREATVSDS